MGAVAQADAQGDGADVEVLHLHHADGLDDLLRGELHRHGEGLPLDPVHVVEDGFVLGVDAKAHLLALGVQPLLDLGERLRGVLQVGHHDHGEELLEGRLRDVHDVGVGLGEHRGHGGDDAHLILADDGDDDAVVLAGIPAIWYRQQAGPEGPPLRAHSVDLFPGQVREEPCGADEEDDAAPLEQLWLAVQRDRQETARGLERHRQAQVTRQVRAEPGMLAGVAAGSRSDTGTPAGCCRRPPAPASCSTSSYSVPDGVITWRMALMPRSPRIVTALVV